jgi:outer membrane protein insertion porin family
MTAPLRRRGGLAIAAAAAAVPAVCLFAPAAAHAQEGQTIAAVEIRGTKNTAPLAAKLAAAGAGIKEGAAFKSDAFTAAKQRIRDVGLYGSVFARTENGPDGSLRVIFEVVENPVVTEIKVTGNRSIPATELLTKSNANKGIDTKAGDVLNEQTLNRDLLAIQKYYQDKGYRAFVTSDIDIDPKTGVLTIPIQETIVESVRVEGLKKTRPVVVTRELKTKEGQPLNSNLLQKDLQKVYNLGIFSDVSNARLEDGSDLGRVNLVIPVQEQRTGQVGVVFGYSVRQRLTGTLELTETNFRGLGEVLNLSWTVGGIAAANQFDLGFTEPWIDKRHTSASFNVYNRFAFRFNRVFSNAATDGTNDDQYYEVRKGGSVTVSRPLSDFTRAFLSLRTENVNANNLLDINDYNNPDNNFSRQDILNIRGGLVSRGNVNSLTLRSVNNTRDNELDPATGTFFSPSFEFGSGDYTYSDPSPNDGQRAPEIPAFNFNNVDDPANKDVPRAFINTRKQTGGFTKTALDFRKYLSLDGPRRASLREPKKVVATRLLLGTSTGNIGFAEQYFMGGADNLRGYADDRFWGNNLFLFSTELRVPLERKSGSLTGVLFFDLGDAWGASDVNREDIPGFRQHNGFSPRAGFGLGVRIKTPVGPVRLDYGIGETSRTHFSIGQAF